MKPKIKSDKKVVIFLSAVIITMLIALGTTVMISKYNSTKEQRELEKNYMDIAEEYFNKTVLEKYPNAKTSQLVNVNASTANPTSESILTSMVELTLSVDNKIIRYRYDVISEQLYSNEYYEEIVDEMISDFYKKTEFPKDDREMSVYLSYLPYTSVLALSDDERNKLSENDKVFLPADVDSFKTLCNNQEIANNCGIFFNFEFTEKDHLFEDYEYSSFLSFNPKFASIFISTYDINNEIKTRFIVSYNNCDISFTAFTPGIEKISDASIIYNKAYFHVDLSELKSTDKETIIDGEYIYSPEEYVYKISSRTIYDFNEKSNAIGGKTVFSLNEDESIIFSIPEKYINSDTKYTYTINDSELLTISSQNETINIPVDSITGNGYLIRFYRQSKTSETISEQTIEI